MRGRAVAGALAAILMAQLASAGDRWSSRPRSGPTPEESGVREWVEAHLAPHEVIGVVGNGQRIGYYSRRPTVAVPDAFFTARPWDLTTLRGAIRRYDIHAVVLSGAAGAAWFARGIPAWLTPAHQSSEVRIFRVSGDTVSSRENGGAR